jgi:hypothetical protein
MEEKISFERPRPFSSGFLIPFHRNKKPIEIILQTTKMELFPKTLAVYVQPDSDIYREIELLDSYAVDLLQKHNNTWFKNDLSKDAIREKYSRTLSSDNYLQIKCSTSHPPKKVYIDDILQEDWAKVAKRLDRFSESIDVIYLTLICHGIYVQKNGFTLLWKIPLFNGYTVSDIQKETCVEECKEEIEQFWKEEINVYQQQVQKEIAQLEKSILAKKERLQNYFEVIQSCKKYTSSDPEWNSSIEYIKHQLFKYRTPAVSS